MFSFFKQWSDNASEYQALQNDLSNILGRQGINFMHLHPEITKCLVGLARKEGAERSVEIINELMETSDKSAEISEKDRSKLLIEACASLNRLGKR